MKVQFVLSGDHRRTGPTNYLTRVDLERLPKNAVQVGVLVHQGQHAWKVSYIETVLGNIKNLGLVGDNASTPAPAVGDIDL